MENVVRVHSGAAISHEKEPLQYGAVSVDLRTRCCEISRFHIQEGTESGDRKWNGSCQVCQRETGPGAAGS